MTRTQEDIIDLYVKWQLLDAEEVGNGELYQFTKSELLDFAEFCLKSFGCDE